MLGSRYCHYLLPSDAIPRPHAKRLQRLEDVLPLLRVEEAVGVELPRVGEVVLAVVDGPVLDLDECLSLIPSHQFSMCRTNHTNEV